MKTKYFTICRFLIKWFIWKPLYRIECLISCGRFYKPHWSIQCKYKWLTHLNYRLCKLSMFYGL